MRTAPLAAALTVAAALGPVAAAAQAPVAPPPAGPPPYTMSSMPIYPVCATSGDGATNCYFQSWEQCWLSVRGNGGFCNVNTFYGFIGTPVGTSPYPLCVDGPAPAWGRPPAAPGAWSPGWSPAWTPLCQSYPSHFYGYGYSYAPAFPVAPGPVTAATLGVRPDAGPAQSATSRRR